MGYTASVLPRVSTGWSLNNATIGTDGNLVIHAGGAAAYAIDVQSPFSTVQLLATIVGQVNRYKPDTYIIIKFTGTKTEGNQSVPASSSFTIPVTHGIQFYDYIKLSLDLVHGLTEVTTIGFLITSKVAVTFRRYELCLQAQIDDSILETIEREYVKMTVLETDYLTAAQVALDYLSAERAALEYMSVEAADIKYAAIEELEAATGRINDLEANSITTEDLEAINATIERIESEYIKTETADIKYLTAQTAQLTYASIVDLDAIEADIDTLRTQYADVVMADIEFLDAEVANIGLLLSGAQTSGSVQTIVLTAQNTSIANALIKSAMIDSLSADKITAGKISTNKVSIESDDGKMVIADETIQISDGSRVRVQIGKDANNDFNITIFDSQGKLMFDATGVHQDAIKEAIIRNDMVSANANINASKLDISSLFNVINNDGTRTINGSKIALDAAGQTLDIVFDSITTKVDDIEAQKMYRLDVVTSNGTTFKNKTGSTVLSAKVYSWDDDITSTIPASSFQWRRVSSNSAADTSWNNTTGKGKKEITITSDDILGRASFSFEVNLP